VDIRKREAGRLMPISLGIGVKLTQIAVPSAGDIIEFPTADFDILFESDVGVTSDGSNRVSAWQDEIAAVSIAQATGGNQPLLVASGINGLPVVRFDKSRPDWLDLTGSTDFTPPYTILALWANRDAFSQTFFAPGPGGADSGVNYGFPGAGLYGPTLVDSTNTLPTDGTFILGEYLFSNTSSEILQDNVVGNTGGTTGNHWAGLTIGRYQGGGFAASMDMALFAMAAGAISSDTRAAAIAYINDKYGLSI
jgi:hypothetical protein